VFVASGLGEGAYVPWMSVSYHFGPSRADARRIPAPAHRPGRAPVTRRASS
jgi:hypothetical protein